MRRAAKRDGNEKAITEALVAVGASVTELSGKDIPDLLVGFRGENFLIEVKNRYGKLRDGQSAWHDAWNGQVATVKTVEEALRVIGAING